MRLGLGMGYGGGVTPLQLALAKTPGAQLYASFRSNLYYVSPTTYASASGVVDALPAGEPTSAGMLVDGADAPTVVQGFGAELVANGGMDADTDWSKGDGWSIAAGKASCDGSQAGPTNFFQGSVLSPVGSVVLVDFTVSDYAAGTVRPYAGISGSGGSAVFANGTYSQTIPVVGNTTMYIQGNADFVGSIDNVSVKQILPFPGAAASATAYTFAIGIDGVSTSVGANKTLLQFHDAAAYGVDGDNRALLYFENTASFLNLGVADAAGAWQGGPGAGGSFNDGLPHTVVGLIDLAGKELKISVDGGAAITSVEPSFPTVFGIVTLGHYNNGAPTAKLSGSITTLALSSGDNFNAWAGL